MSSGTVTNFPPCLVVKRGTLHFAHFSVGDIVVGTTIPVEGRLGFGVGVAVTKLVSSTASSYFTSCRCGGLLTSCLCGGLLDGGVGGPDEKVVEVESEKSEPKSGVRSRTSGSWRSEPIEVMLLSAGVSIACFDGSGVDKSSEDKKSPSLPKQLTDDFVRNGKAEELDGSANDKNWESGRAVVLETLDLTEGEPESRDEMGMRD